MHELWPTQLIPGAIGTNINLKDVVIRDGIEAVLYIDYSIIIITL